MICESLPEELSGASVAAEGPSPGGIAAATGARAVASVRDALQRLAGRGGTAPLLVNRTALAAVPRWRQGSARGPWGTLVLVLDGDLGGPEDRRLEGSVGSLAQQVARLADGRVGDGLVWALETVARPREGRFALVAAWSDAPGRLATVRRGRGLMVAEGPDVVLLSSPATRLPGGLARVGPLSPDGAAIVLPPRSSPTDASSPSGHERQRHRLIPSLRPRRQRA